MNNIATKTLAHIQTKIRYASQEQNLGGILESIADVTQDILDEVGVYKPEFVRDVLRAKREKPTYTFTTPTSFLKHLRKS